MSVFNLGSLGSTLATYVGAWTNTGGSLPTILNDGSDATYIKRTSASPGNAVMGQAVPTLPANEVMRRARWRCRMTRPASASVAVALGVRKYTGGAFGDFFGADTSYTGVKGATTFTGPWETTLAYNGYGLVNLLDSSKYQLLVKVKDKVSDTAACTSFLELGYDLETASIPVAPTVTTPSTTDTSSPQVPWTHNDTQAFTITNRASSGTTRTLTVGTHTMLVGNDVIVEGTNANYAGIWKITAVTATTISYTGGSSLTEGTTATTGTATIGDGAAQTAYEVRVFTAAQYGAGGFDPATSAATWESGVVGSSAGSATVGISLTNGVTYRAYVRTAKDVNGTNVFGPFGFATFTMAVTPAAASISASFDSANNRVQLTLAGNGNILSAQDANLEVAGDTGSWIANANCSITQSTTFADIGSGSLRLSSTAAGTMSARTAAGTAGDPVLGSTVYSAIARVRAGASARTCTIGITWYDSAGGTISTSTGTGVADATGSFTTISVTATSPANAAFASVIVTVASTAAAAELHYVDKIAIHPGSTPAYSPGGVTYSVALTRTPSGDPTVDVRPPLTLDVAQKATVYDYEAPRGIQSTYSFTLIGTSVLTSAVVYSAAVTANVTPTNDGTWWVKAMGSPALNRGSMRILADPKESREEALGTFRLEGRPDVVVVSGQMFGDDPDYEIYTSGATEWEAVKALFVDFQGTLLIQEPFTDSTGQGLQKHVRVTDRSWTKTGTPQVPRYQIQVKAFEVGKGY